MACIEMDFTSGGGSPTPTPEELIVPLVPVMTSDTAPYGQAISDAQTSGCHAYNAFDDNPSTNNASSNTSGTADRYIGYVFPTPAKVSKVYVYKDPGTAGTYNLTIQYSDDGSNWLVAKTGISVTQGDDEGTFELDDFGYHKYWRVFSNNSTGRFSFIKVQFYGSQILINDNRFTSWATDKPDPIRFDPLVPKLSSNVTDLLHSNDYSGSYVAWHAFDRNPETLWATSGNPGWIGYDFHTPTTVLMFTFYTTQLQQGTFKLQGADEPTFATPTDLTDFVSVQSSTNVVATNVKAFRCVRVLFNGGGTCNTALLQFYGYKGEAKTISVDASGTGTFGTLNNWSEKVQLNFKPSTIWVGGYGTSTMATIDYQNGTVRSYGDSGGTKYIDTPARLNIQVNEDNSFQVLQAIGSNLNGQTFRYFATGVGPEPAPGMSIEIPFAEVNTTYDELLSVGVNGGVQTLTVSKDGIMFAPIAEGSRGSISVQINSETPIVADPSNPSAKQVVCTVKKNDVITLASYSTYYGAGAYLWYSE